jgi:hypothetical protein
VVQEQVSLEREIERELRAVEPAPEEQQTPPRPAVAEPVPPPAEGAAEPGAVPTGAPDEEGYFGQRGAVWLFGRPAPTIPPQSQRLKTIDEMNQARPRPSLPERLRVAAAEVRRGLVDRYRPLARLAEEEFAITQRRVKRGESAHDLALAAQGKTAGQITEVTVQLGRLQEIAKQRGLEKYLNVYLTLTQMMKRITDLHSNPANNVDQDGYYMKGPKAGTTVNPRGYDRQEVLDAMQDMRQELTPAQLSTVHALANGIWGVNRDILKRAYMAGIVSPESYLDIISRGIDYVPFHVIDWIVSEAATRQTGGGRAYSVSYQHYLRSLEGTERDVQNVIEASLDKAISAITAINQNLVARRIVELHTIMPNTIRLLPPSALPPTTATDEVPIHAFVGGKRQSVAVPTDIGRALEALDEPSMGLLQHILGRGSKILRAGATGANLAFTITNLARDLARVGIMSRYGWGTFLELNGAFWSYLYKDDEYLEFLRSGAATATFQRMVSPSTFLGLGIDPNAAPDVRSRQLQERLRKGGALGVQHWKQWRFEPWNPKAWLETIEKVNDAIEQSVKYAAYRRGKTLGDTEAGRTYEALNFGGSPNFLKAGLWSKDLNLISMFFSARMAGVSTDLARLAGKERLDDGSPAANRARIHLAAVAILPTALLYAANARYDDDHGMEEIPIEERWRNWIILRNETYQASDGTTRRKYWKIRKNEFVGILSGFVESGLDYLRARDPRSITELMIRTMGDLAPIGFQYRDDSFPGFFRGLTDGVLAGLNPIAKVPLEWASNWNYYHNRDVVPQSLVRSGLPPSEQERPGGSWIPRVLSQTALMAGWEVSPLTIDHALQGAFAGLYSRGARPAADLLGDKLSTRRLDDTLDAYEATVRKWPVIGAVMGIQGDAIDDKSESELYEKTKQASQVAASLKDATEKGDMDRVMARIENNLGDISRVEIYEELTHDLAEVRATMAVIAAMEGMDPEIKRGLMETFAEIRHAILDTYRLVQDNMEDVEEAHAAPPVTTSLAKAAAGG